MSKRITLWFDGRRPVYTDEDEFGLVKMMVEEAGGCMALLNIQGPVEDLERQGYNKNRALDLCLLARRALIEEHK